VSRGLISALLLVAGWWPPAIASAHLGSTKYLDVELGDSEVVVEAAVEAVDASMELGLGEDFAEDALTERSARIGEWLGDGIRIEGGGRACSADASDLRFTTRDERRFVEVTLRYRCEGGGPYVLEDDTVFPDDPQHEAFVRVVASGETDARILRRGRQNAELGTPPSASSLAWLFIVEGAIHLATGYDHILFLLSLVLAAGLVAVRRSRREALRDVAIIVTAFTLGHSVTLVAAALEWVVLPSRPVEAIIALSIVVVALLNVAKPGARKPMPYLAVGFGLIHGFGFSSVLAEQGLPGHQRVLALVAFNVGIEVAQLLFVALLLWPLSRLAQHEESYERWVVRGGSTAIALIAGLWFVERVFL
jgi:hypothetical protein